MKVQKGTGTERYRKVLLQKANRAAPLKFCCWTLVRTLSNL